MLFSIFLENLHRTIKTFEEIYETVNLKNFPFV